MKTNPFTILTASLDLICTNLGCDHRIGMSPSAKMHTATMTLLRIAFLLVCSAAVGGGFIIRVHAENLMGERTARLEAQSLTMESRVARLETNASHDETAIATMGGEFEGVGVVLGILQIAQMALGRGKKNA